MLNDPESNMGFRMAARFIVRRIVAHTAELDREVEDYVWGLRRHHVDELHFENHVSEMFAYRYEDDPLESGNGL